MEPSSPDSELDSLPLYYEASGKISPLALFSLPLFGLFASIVTALLYSIAIYYMPFVYINFLLSIIFGVTLAFFLQPGILLGKVRAPGKLFLIGTAIAVLALYLQWIVHLSLLIHTGDALYSSTTWRFGTIAFHKTTLDFSLMLEMAFSPALVWEAIQFLYAEGSWSIGEGDPISGKFLGAIWIIEAIIIVVVSVCTVSLLGNRPFSEKDNRWLKKKKLSTRFAASDAVLNNLSRIEEGAFDMVLSSSRVAKDRDNISVILYHDRAEEEGYVDLDLNVYGEDKNVHTSELFRGLRIAPVHIRRILQRFS